MELFCYIALLLAQAGTSAKQFAMKYCGKLAPGPFNSICINVMRSVICLIVSLVIWLMIDGGTTTLFGHVLIFISAIGTALNLFVWILATQLATLIVIECVSMIGSLVVPMFVAPYLYDGDYVSLLQWIGCILIFVCVFLFSGGKSEKKKNGSLSLKILAVSACAFGNMLSGITKKFYTYQISQHGLGTVEYFTFACFAIVLAIFLVLFPLFYNKEKQNLIAQAPAGADVKVPLPYKRAGVYILIAAVALYVNELFTVYASQLPSAIYYPLARGLTVGCTFLMDSFVFKEKVTLRKLIGLVLVILAIILVNL